jgi:MFS family permease
MNEINYPHFRWFILLTAIITMTIIGMSLIAPAPLIPLIMKTMPQFSLSQIFIITMTIFNLFIMLSALITGFLFNRIGLAKIYIGGLVMIAIGALLVPFIGASLHGMSLIRSLQGFGTGSIMVAVAPLAATYFPYKERSIVTGFLGIAPVLGISLGLIIIPMIYNITKSWQTALTWIAPICILGIILSIIVAFGPKPLKDIKGLENDVPSKNKLIDRSPHYAVFTQPVTWIAICCAFLLSWAYQAFNDVIPNYLSSDTHGLNLGYGKAAEILYGVTIYFMGGSILGGMIIDKSFLKGNVKPIIIIGFLFGALSTFLISLPFMISNYIVMVFSILGAAFFFSFVNPQIMGYIAKNYPKHVTGSLSGLVTGFSILGGWLGPVLGAVALNITGSYQISIYIMASICAVGFIISLFLNPIKDKIHEEPSHEMSLGEILFSFKGRINRATFWLFLISIEIILILSVTAGFLLDKKNGILAGYIIGAILIIWPMLSLNIKRCHDRDHSGIFFLISLIPILNIWYMIEIGFSRGTKDDNKYGADPNK